MRFHRLLRFVEGVEKNCGDFTEFGLAVPGLVNILANQVVDSSQLPDLEGADLADRILAATGKRVFLENDANAAAYGELRCGSGQSAKDFFYVLTGSGIGGALVLDRKVWHGVSGFAGEFGYIALNTEGRRLEELTASDGIVDRAKNRLHQDPTSSLFEINEEDIEFDDIVNAANVQDDLAELILERTGTFLGTAIAGVINLLNIEKVVIGGGLMRSSEVVIGAITTRASELSFEPAFEAVSIEPGALTDYPAAIGAALIVLDKGRQ